MQGRLSFRDLDFTGKKALIRVDFNVPLDKEGNISDDTRIVKSIPTVRHVLEHGGAVVLMSHLGRPKGQKISEFSLAPCAKRLSELLGVEVLMAPDCIGPDVVAMAQKLQPGQVMLLENLRFYKAETKPEEDPEFARSLASLGDVYVNDAFGTAHREHSSTATVAHLFPKHAAAGYLLEKEIQFIGGTLTEPKRPFYAIIGGSKVSTKIGVIKSLISKADAIFVGGGMCFTFFKAQGIEIGASIHEDDYLDTAKEVMEICKSKNVDLHLPKDIVVAETFDNDAPHRTIAVEEGISEGFYGMDVGPKTIEQYNAALADAATILWNGPLGVFEMNNFAKGTLSIAQSLAKLSATTIIGGGDSIAAVQKAGVADQISHLSTGGGASLEFIERGTLPGIEALTEV